MNTPINRQEILKSLVVLGKIKFGFNKIRINNLISNDCPFIRQLVN
nr:MAG TPA: hypothetical protein [Caudoviricetes sp.]